MRLAHLLKGNKQLGNATTAETIWADPESRSEGETVDAALKLRTLGMPLEALWERVGASPQEVAAWARMAGLPQRPPAGATTAAVPGPSANPTPTPGGIVLPAGTET
jgi:hypothetical protein